MMIASCEKNRIGVRITAADAVVRCRITAKRTTAIRSTTRQRSVQVVALMIKHIIGERAVIINCYVCAETHIDQCSGRKNSVKRIRFAALDAPR